MKVRIKKFKTLPGHWVDNMAYLSGKTVEVIKDKRQIVEYFVVEKDAYSWAVQSEDFVRIKPRRKSKRATAHNKAKAVMPKPPFKNGACGKLVLD